MVKAREDTGDEWSFPKTRKLKLVETNCSTVHRVVQEKIELEDVMDPSLYNESSRLEISDRGCFYTFYVIRNIAENENVENSNVKWIPQSYLTMAKDKAKSLEFDSGTLLAFRQLDASAQDNSSRNPTTEKSRAQSKTPQ